MQWLRVNPLPIRCHHFFLHYSAVISRSRSRSRSALLPPLHFINLVASVFFLAFVLPPPSLSSPLSMLKKELGRPEIAGKKNMNKGERGKQLLELAPPVDSWRKIKCIESNPLNRVAKGFSASQRDNPMAPSWVGYCFLQACRWTRLIPPWIVVPYGI